MEGTGLNWGKCRLGVFWQYAGTTETSNHIFPVAAEDTTQLNTEEGDEIEATIEGGEVEATRYTSNKYTLSCELRTLDGRKKPLKDADGRIAGTGKVILIPETPDAYGLLIEKASARLVDSFTAADGGRWAYNFKALKPAAGDQCKLGTFTIKDKQGAAITDIDAMTTDSIGSITFQPVEVEGEDKEDEIEVYSA